MSYSAFWVFCVASVCCQNWLNKEAWNWWELEELEMCVVVVVVVIIIIIIIIIITPWHKNFLAKIIFIVINLPSLDPFLSQFNVAYSCTPFL
jgi:hypothetical protein